MVSTTIHIDMVTATAKVEPMIKGLSGPIRVDFSENLNLINSHMYKNCNAGYGSARQQYGAPVYGKHRGGAGPYRRPKNNVPVNIIDKEDVFEVHLYALGFDKENITVSVSENLLSVNGTRTLAEGEAPNFLRQEYPIKSFERVIQLNDKVDVAGISARQENGVLIVTLPKKPETSKPGQNIAIA